jgi:hypothetical protein
MRHLGFAKVSSAVVAALALAAMVTRAQSVDPSTQTSEIPVQTVVSDPCTGEPVLIEEVIRLSATKIVNPDGTYTARLHAESHGTGTGLRTGTQYVINGQEMAVTTVQDPCNFTTSKVNIRQGVVSKGPSDNFFLTVSYTFGVSNCQQFTGPVSVTPECRG